MVVRVMKGKHVVASSKNLEVILRYQRQNAYIKKVTQHGKTMTVNYADGAICKTKFASAKVLSDWIERKRIRGVFPKVKGGALAQRYFPAPTKWNKRRMRYYFLITGGPYTTKKKAQARAERVAKKLAKPNFSRVIKNKAGWWAYHGPAGAPTRSR